MIRAGDAEGGALRLPTRRLPDFLTGVDEK
jgi:hypothetical protein